MIFKKNALLLLLLTVLSCGKTQNSNNTTPTPPPTPPPVVPNGATVQWWLTTPNQSALLQQQTALRFGHAANANDIVGVDSTITYQSMDGFGYTFTGGSAYLMAQLPEAQQNNLLNELFGQSGNSIGVNYLRVSIGASDLSNFVFSYNDLNDPNATDEALANFSLAEDTKYLIPLLKKIIAIQPGIKILGSPWSAPVWMKTNKNSKGGSLKPEFYDAYARYLVKYIQAMQKEGITIDAITVQNEPLHDGNNPSMYMAAADQAIFIKNNLGPAFTSAGIKTKIIIYDHNCDLPDYPISILKDAEARKYINGSAFHLYAGDIGALSVVHAAFPEKDVYFTEQWVGGPSNFGGDLQWHIKNLIIGAPRNWSKTVLEWNLAADANYQPRTPGGCSNCLGAITIQNQTVTRNVAYYIIGHASKFVPAGSKRIISFQASGLPNVAFLTPSGKKVLIVLNETNASKTFNIQFNNSITVATLPAGAVATYEW